MGHSRTPTQNTAGGGFPADPIDSYVRASVRASPPAPGADTGAEELKALCAHHRSAQTARHQAVAACATCPGPGGRSGGVADAGGSVSAAMHAVSRRRI